MQMTGEINDIGVSPSFNWYSTDNSTSKAAARVGLEVKEEQEFSDTKEEDFEFSLDFAGEEFTAKELALAGRMLLTIFDTDLVTMDEVDHELKELNRDVSSLIIPLDKLLVSDSGELMSYSSSEAEEVEDKVSGTFCVSWRKSENQRSDLIKKSKSTGSASESGSRRWKVKDILHRSNSAGKETVFLLCPKRVEESNKKRIVKSGEAQKVAGKSKTASAPSVHELFYVQKKAEQKGDKMRSYLPYRRDLLGFKVHVNGNGTKKLPF